VTDVQKSDDTAGDGKQPKRPKRSQKYQILFHAFEKIQKTKNTAVNAIKTDIIFTSPSNDQKGEAGQSVKTPAPPLPVWLGSCVNSFLALPYAEDDCEDASACSGPSNNYRNCPSNQ